MEYWEFLLQKEGDRTWRPIKSKRIEIEEGRYRVVAHSSRINTDVEICVIYESTEEIPPKRRSQKRSRRTNPEGLMVVIPFTYLKPGLWELRCCGDILSDFLGLSWQHSIQLQIISKVTEVSPVAESDSPKLEASLIEVQASLSENVLSSTSETEITVEPTSPPNQIPQLTPLEAIEAVESEPDTNVEVKAEENPSELVSSESSSEGIPLTLPSQDTVAFEQQLVDQESETLDESENLQPNLSTTLSVESWVEDLTLNIDEAEAQPITLADQVAPLAPVESDEQNSVFPDHVAQAGTPTNPILDQSLQMLEQILQQVLDPVIQDFERSESSEPQIVPELDLPLETETNQPGILLTLDDESLVARRGESLLISGLVDAVDVNHLNGDEATSKHRIFQAFLSYELRDPQTSRILLAVEQPLPKQDLPLAFTHTLEIPLDCQTRLILGKVTLYDRRVNQSQESTPVALASQPFTVTADLDELLGAIIPGTRAMPVAKMLLLNKNPDALQNAQEDSLEAAILPPVNRPILNLVDVNQSPQSLSLQPSSGQTLPPQIYQASSTPKPLKSPQLPILPKIRSITTSAELSITPNSSEKVEVNLENWVEQLQPLLGSNDSASSPSKALPMGTPEEAVIELPLHEQVQDSSQQEEDAPQETLQVLEALAIAVDVSDLSESPTVVSDALISVVPSHENTADVTKIEETDGDNVDNVSQENWELENSEYREKIWTEEDWDLDAEADQDAQPSVSISWPAVPTESLSPLQEADVLSISSLNDESRVMMPDSEHPTVPVEPLWDDSDANPIDTTATDLQPTESLSVTESTASWMDTLGEDRTSAIETAESSDPVIVDNAFQALNIQDRFWLRLNSMATDAELSEWLKSDVFSPTAPAQTEDVTPPSEPDLVNVDVEEVTQPLTANTLLTDFDTTIWEEESDDDFSSNVVDTDDPLQPPPLEENPFPEEPLPPVEEKTALEEQGLDQLPWTDIVDLSWASQEFVVDDDDLPAPETTVVRREEAAKVTHEELHTPQPQTPSVQPQKPQSPQLRPLEIPQSRQLDLPIPAPELSIPTNELAAGEPVIVRVKLPPHSSRLCVKLWVQDRQSRSLLDGPRWLMDLIPDRTGEQEALTQLTIPFGSMEIRFEAIAVDIDSQRESHKVAVDCIVVPPDMPNLSLDEFEAQ